MVNFDQIIFCWVHVFWKCMWVQSLLFERTSFLMHHCIILQNHFHSYLQLDTRGLIMYVLI